MELSQIRYFILTAQLQNMSQAAHALGIAQPTLSKHISNLEKELGTQLFDRSGKKLILNERGQRFLDGAMLSLEELENATASVQDESIESTLVLGLFCISEAFMKCLGSFSSQNPETALNVYQLHGSPTEIDTNKFDALLYTGDTLFRRYRGSLAYTEKYSLAVHKSSELSVKGSVSVGDLTEQKLVFIKYDKKGFDLPYHLYNNITSSRQSHVYTNSYELQRQMISAGCCVGFVPDGCIQSYASDENIVLIPISDDGFSQDIYIGFKREKHLSASGKLFLSYATEYFSLKEA